MRRQLRGIAIAVETLLRLAADAAGAAVELLAPRFDSRGPAEGSGPPVDSGPWTEERIEHELRGGIMSPYRQTLLDDGEPVDMSQVTLGARYPHAHGCTPAGCVPGCATLERLEGLREAGYLSTPSDDMAGFCGVLGTIRDDESTRGTDAAIIAIRRRAGGCVSLSPVNGHALAPYICEREAGHPGHHEACGEVEELDGSRRVETWADR